MALAGKSIPSISCFHNTPCPQISTKPAAKKTHTPRACCGLAIKNNKEKLYVCIRRLYTNLSIVLNQKWNKVIIYLFIIYLGLILQKYRMPFEGNISNTRETYMPK